MTETNYLDAIALIDRATALLKARKVVPPVTLMYELRRLQRALDALRVQIGQSPPELRRN